MPHFLEYISKQKHCRGFGKSRFLHTVLRKAHWYRCLGGIEWALTELKMQVDTPWGTFPPYFQELEVESKLNVHQCEMRGWNSLKAKSEIPYSSKGSEMNLYLFMWIDADTWVKQARFQMRPPVWWSIYVFFKTVQHNISIVEGYWNCQLGAQSRERRNGSEDEDVRKRDFNRRTWINNDTVHPVEPAQLTSCTEKIKSFQKPAQRNGWKEKY